jgi:hypothetical protein
LELIPIQRAHDLKVTPLLKLPFWAYNSDSGSAFRQEATRLATEHGSLEQLLATARELKVAIGALGVMFPGSLVERFRKCGKPNCHCAKKGSKGHGPTWVVTREIEGRTVTKTIPEQAVEQIRAETEEYKHFRQLSHDLIETSAQLGEVRLKQAAAREAFKKNRTRRQSGR